MLLLLLLFIFYVNSAYYAMEIIQPQEGLDTINRYYKAYPGLEYNVRIGIIGGSYPFIHEIIQGPSEMMIDERSGEITWTNPTELGSPHTVSIRVSDQEDTVETVTWTITVTTNGFYFVDSNNGVASSSGGTGTIDNPWRSMFDWFEGDVYDSKYARSYEGGFLYFREGTYPVDAYKEDGSTRVPMVANYKPQVWLAYPNESPVIDLSNGYLAIYGGSSNVYFDGLTFHINNLKGITIASASHDFTFRKNKIYGIVGGYTGGNNACIFITRDNTCGDYWSIQDNDFSIVDEGYGILGYNGRNVLIEDNFFHEIGTHPVGPKEGTQKWDIRRNVFENNNLDSIGLQYSASNGILSGDIEMRYNLVKSGGGMIRVNSNADPVGYPVYLYGNTVIDDLIVRRVTDQTGPFYFYNNVIINSETGDHIQCNNDCEYPANVIVSDNLGGTTENNIVDSNGRVIYTSCININDDLY